MFPQDKAAALARALQQVFGTSEPDGLQPLPSGVSSDLLYRVRMRGEHFLLTVLPQINEINDPVRRFTCMKMAADAGVAPEVRYMNFTDGVILTRLIEARPQMVDDARLQIPRMLARLHSLPHFPKEFNYVTADKSIQRFRGAHLLTDDRLAGIYEPYSRLAAMYPRVDPDMVSCHMDLRRETVNFDGDRVWLSDWRAGFVNDRYFDLSVAANYLIANEVEEQQYLNEYFGRAASSYESARFFLMRQIVNTLAASLYLLIGSQGKPLDDTQLKKSFVQLHRELWDGATDLQNHSSKLLYGLTHWHELEKNLKSPRFEESLEIVAAHHADGSLPTLLPVQ